MKKIILFLLPLFISTAAFADTIPIPRTQYTLIDYSSANSNHPAAYAIDGYHATYWELNDGTDFPMPAFIEIDLGDTLAVNGFKYRPNSGNSWERLSGYELYLSIDGSTWGDPEVIDHLEWETPDSYGAQSVYFGAVDARYIKLVYTSSDNSPSDNIFTAELDFYQNTDGPSGLSNQTIVFEDIPKQYADADPITLEAEASSGLAVTFAVVSGPANVSGNTLTLTGEEGIVEVSATQAGNSEYYPITVSQSFEVVDLSLILPEVQTSLTDAIPLEMASGLQAYPIYIHTAIDESDQLTVDDVSVTVGGNTYPTEEGDGYRYYLWTPENFGPQEVSITATASNGNDSTLTQTIDVTDSAEDQVVTTLDQVVVEFGGENSRWYEGNYTMPQHVGSYDHIQAYLGVSCPNGNCDDWDRLAYFEVQAPSGDWVQIIRYITPYGVGCYHNLDVTDYASLLQGNVRFRVFIDTWGTGGWKLHLDFDHIAGTPEYMYSEVVELWDGTYDFGNLAHLQPVDTVAFAFPETIEASHIRLSTTGHGWGANNTSNAAEFFHATHYVDLNGSQGFVQDLWNDCNPNPDNCNNQAGTWQYDRAGWCPGSIAPPNLFDLGTPAGQTTQFTYRFDPDYVDYCHPENPNCISGVTCDDCNDGYNPHYVVDGQLINFSNIPMIGSVLGTKTQPEAETLRLEVYPNPATASFRLSTAAMDGRTEVTLYNISGLAVKHYVFADHSRLENYSFSTSTLAPGVYFLALTNAEGAGVARVVVQ